MMTIHSKVFGGTNFEPTTLVELLRWRATNFANSRAYTYLQDGEENELLMTYADLDRRARAIGAWLQSLGAAGERALLIYPPGIEYVVAFFGCLYAGVTAVPAYPPDPTRLNRTLPRLQAIAQDAQASLALTNDSILSMIKIMRIGSKVTDSLEKMPFLKKFGSSLSSFISQRAAIVNAKDLSDLNWLSTEDIKNGYGKDWKHPEIDKDTLAFLQYTSGSTGIPRGVMLSHENLLYNLALINEGFGSRPDSEGVIWLPIYHDMGLIGGVMQPLYAGFPCALMSPVDFLQHPLRWLNAISRVRNKQIISGGPNFAYDLCARKVTPEQKEKLRLEHWKVAFSGAEPVRPETIDRFSETFKPCGFKREAFYPCYGLAEATLFVSGGYNADPPIILNIKKSELKNNCFVEALPGEDDSQTAVGCGHTYGDQTITIVNPETFEECRTGEIGEIWIAGTSVAKGYWNRPGETKETFQAHIRDNEAVSFLRTGDLGFLKDGELFITGRIKDLIIIRGRNHYPQDIEFTVENSHQNLRPGCSAVFSVDIDDQERLIIVVEVRNPKKLDADEIIGSIRRQVTEAHELQAFAVALIKPRSISKTSSGKIQRRATKNEFLNGKLQILAEWRASGHFQTDISPEPEVKVEKPVSEPVKTEVPVVNTKKSATVASIETWLIAKVAENLEIDINEIDIREPFVSFGLDSAQAVGLAGDLEVWLGKKLSPTLVWDYPTIESLANYLAEDETASAASPEITASTTVGSEPIAIIGIGCRFPGANDVDAFWNLLQNGVDAIGEVPPDRWNIDEYYDSSPGIPGKMYNRTGGFLDKVDLFDPDFFSISPREAKRMDPQQRILLEIAWQALENAGLVPNNLAGSKTGVFVGISNNDYSKLQHMTEIPEAYHGTGNAFSIAANRISYWFDFHGPSMAVDTACSSSLVSVHLAIQSLRNGESNLAVAGGVNLILTPEANLIFSHARMMSIEGRCKTFDASADGYVRGEGCGIIILKRLSDALKDGNRILAVIRGSAINQDGRSNGITAPNGLAQQEVIQEALKNARVLPEQIGYVEAHGTGTILGDPIEVQSLAAVMKDRSTNKPCLIGSVKTNIGHLESAAGIAGLIKTILSLYYEEIPAHLHFKKINPHILIDELPLEIPTERRLWKSGGERRFAAVSSFGFGGTNSHIVLEEAPARQPVHNEVERPLHLLLLSGKTENALNELIKLYVGYLSKNKSDSLADICFAANSGRSHFAQRLAVTAENVQQMRERLSALAEGQPVFEANRGEGKNKKRSKIAFLFTGQGSQYIGMGRTLYETQPTFQKALDRCDQILKNYLERPLLTVIFPENENSELIHETAYTQPALFSIEYALAQLWRSWGIEPNYVIGHSVGEYVAACIAGVFSLEDGLKLIATRGKLMSSLPHDGDMAVIFADQKQVSTTIEPYRKDVSIAGVNGHNNIVISGKKEVIQKIVEKFQAEGIESRSLKVSHAFHSPLMDSILDEFEQVASEVHYQTPAIPIISNLTGNIIDANTIPDASYWRRHIREAVQFHAGMQTLAEQGCEIFIEPGPNPVMIGMGRRCLPDVKGIWLASLKQDQPDWQMLLNSLGMLYVNGIEIDWAGFDRDYQRVLVSLPNYPFQRERYWVESSVTGRPKIVGAALENNADEIAQFQDEKTQSPVLAERNQPNLTRQTILDSEPDQQLGMLQSYLKREIALVMSLNINRIDINQPVNNLGLDSIMAIELKNKIEKRLEVDYPIASLLEGPNIIQISQQLLEQMTAPETATSKIIPASEKILEYPLSYGQRAMWFQHQMAPESIYNLLYAVRIRSEVDVPLLKQAFQTLIDRHPTLRTTFHAVKGEPVQKVHEAIDVDFQHEDASAWSEEDLQKRLEKETRMQFNLETGPLFRVHLFSKSNDEHILLETIHHIVADLWSQAIIANEIGILYSALISHENPELPPIEIQYSDFVRWHSEMLEGAEGEKLWGYWKEKLSGELPVLNLPTDRPRPAVQTFRGVSKTIEFKPELIQKLKKVSEQHGATMYMTLLAAFNVMLQRYSGQDDLIVGTPTTGRSRNELAPLVGYFVNPLPIRSDLSGNPKFSEFLSQVRKTVVEAIDHQSYPFGLLVEKLHPRRDTSRTPLFQVMFVFQRAHLLYEEGLSSFAISSEGEQMNLGGLPLEAFKLEETLSPFDFTLMLAETKNSLAASLTYNTDLFDSNTIDQMLWHFQTLLESIANNSERNISELNLLPKPEIEKLLEDFAGNQVSDGADKCFHELFEEKAQQMPDALAVVFEDKQLTYRELNQSANKLAHYLKKLGVKPDIKVAIFVERSSEMIVEILGVLKAGGAYLPLDPAYPAERLSLMLDDSNASILIKQRNLELSLPSKNINVIDIDAEWEKIARESNENPISGTAPDNLAYMIYTSGSTGKPKGTLLQHRGLCNFATAHVTALGVNENMRMLQFASFSFDASVSEIFTTLMAGGTLYLARRETILSTPSLVELIQKHQINSAILPPSMLAILPGEKLSSLKRIISAGESCPWDVASNWAKDRNFYNGYGPTEATVGPTIYRVDPGKNDTRNIPIGRPLNNIRSYILDRYLNPVPVNVSGELHIGGICLARGYHNHPGMTAVKFVPDPFSNKSGARMYKTGDLARFLPDGNIEFLGRIDHQVKIRGFRIEVEEIESHLTKHPAVENVIVMARQDNSGENKLIAYITKDHKPVPDNGEIREFLKTKLPDYMIPSFFIFLESFPLTQSGKIDRKALPQPDDLKLATDATYVKPRTEIEQNIAAIWQDVLRLEKVGVYDNFFDLGGHSLAMAKVHNQLCEQLKQDISIVDLFKYPTIYSLSQYFAAEKEKQPIFIEKQQRALQQRKAMDVQRERLAKRRAIK